jgi:vitamin B12/bleomycin/antimicrobial peptide transport system ATP-binding/permease protein
MRMTRGTIAPMREAWRLAKPYFRSEEKWKAYGLLITVMMFNLITVYGQVLNTYWFKYAYNALQQKQAHAFWALAVTYERVPEFPYFIPGFLGIGAILTVSSTYATYLQQMLQIAWWRWLTKSFVENWMACHAYYHLALKGEVESPVDNPDQRITDDLNNFVNFSLTLTISFVTNFVTIVSYIGVLWSASTPMHPFGIHIAGYLVWVALLYSGVGTLFAHLIGRKLIDLNFLQQRFQADMRFNLVRIRENTEQIALYGGEREEALGAMNRFGAIYLNWWQIMRRTKVFNFFTLGFTNFAIFVSLIVGAQDYFLGTISLGVLMLINSSFNSVQTAFSWFVSSYQQIVAWRAAVRRLDGFERGVREVRVHAEVPGITATTKGDKFVAQNLSIQLPDGRGLFSQPRFEFDRGCPLAITGPSGSGKSTLFRALAGIWPFGHGHISRPSGRLMFLPQKPYFPLGPLKEAITYPRSSDEVADEVVQAALADVGLQQLGGELKRVDNWTLRLSGGEQQRLALARALIVRPDWLFLDEALAALDESAARNVFAMLRAKLSGTQFVSIVHYATVLNLHPRKMALVAGATGAMRLDMRRS